MSIVFEITTDSPIFHQLTRRRTKYNNSLPLRKSSESCMLSEGERKNWLHMLHCSLNSSNYFTMIKLHITNRLLNILLSTGLEVIHICQHILQIHVSIHTFDKHMVKK